MTEQKRIYDEYINSSHWQTLRKHMFGAFGKSCQSCKKAKGIHHVHHIKYRTPLESCIPADLMILCVGCHDTLHEFLKTRGLPLPDSRELTHRIIGMALVAKRSDKLSNRKAMRLERQKTNHPKQKVPSQLKRVSRKLFVSFSHMRAQGFKKTQAVEFIRDFLIFMRSHGTPISLNEI